MKRMIKTFTGMALVFLAGTTVWVRGADNEEKNSASSGRSYRIPFRVDPAEQARLLKVRLFVSEDRGAHWRLVEEVVPDKMSFTFRASQAGSYWLAVQSVAKNGAEAPENIGALKPTMVVRMALTPTLVTYPERDGSLPKAALGDSAPREEYEALRHEVEELKKRLDALERKLPRP